jgi:hypothetical protein
MLGFVNNNNPLELVCSEIMDFFLSSEIEFLSKSGITLPYNMQGLNDDQIVELKLVDDFSEKCIPSGGYIESKDDLGRRNGRGMLRNCHCIDLKSKKKEVFGKPFFVLLLNSKLQTKKWLKY